MVQRLDFDDRVQRLNRKHQAMANGYRTYMRPDGLVVAQPVRQKSRFSLRFVLFIGLAVLAFKGFLLSALGPGSYEARVVQLQEGTTVERAGAWLMQVDPVSLWISEQIGPVLR